MTAVRTLACLHTSSDGLCNLKTGFSFIFIVTSSFD